MISIFLNKETIKTRRIKLRACLKSLCLLTVTGCAGCHQNKENAVTETCNLDGTREMNSKFYSSKAGEDGRFFLGGGKGVNGMDSAASGYGLVRACSTFCVVRVSREKFGPHAGSRKFRTQWIFRYIVGNTRLKERQRQKCIKCSSQPWPACQYFYKDELVTYRVSQ